MGLLGKTTIKYSVVLVFSLILLISCKKDDVVKVNFDDQFETFTDERDGHVYKLIKIGTQTWMAENLAYLPKVNSLLEFSETNERYYVEGYNGNNVEEAVLNPNYEKFGVHYNWTAAQTASPEGWHIPSQDEWQTMMKYIVEGSGGPRIKNDSLAYSLMAPFGWTDFFDKDSIDNENTGRNRTLFSALPAGYLYHDGKFYSVGSSAFWWSASEDEGSNASNILLTSNFNGYHEYIFNKELGMSVRCLKD
jgi:uncharacterized protein (TIGR02145 family)